MPGGTSYYFSHGISHLKDTKHYQLVTALAPSEFKAVEDIQKKASKLLLFLVTGQCILRIHTVRIKTTAASGYWLKPILHRRTTREHKCSYFSFGKSFSR